MVFDAHNRAFAFFRRACTRGIYDNMKTAGGRDLHRKGSPLQPPLRADVRALPRRARGLHAGVRRGKSRTKSGWCARTALPVLGFRWVVAMRTFLSVIATFVIPSSRQTGERTSLRRPLALHRQLGLQAFNVPEDGGNGERSSVAFEAQKAIPGSNLAVDLDLVPSLGVADIVD